MARHSTGAWIAAAAAFTAWTIGLRRLTRGAVAVGVIVVRAGMRQAAVIPAADPFAAAPHPDQATGALRPRPVARPHGWGALWPILKETFAGWSADRVPRLAAALAYYTIFSLAPLLLICLYAVGLFFDRASVQRQLVAQFGQLIGKQGQQAIETMLGAGSATGSSLLATVLGVAILIYTATNVFAELQNALDSIWKVGARPGRSLMLVIRQRFAPFTMILGCGFLLVTSLVASTVVTAMAGWFGQRFPALQIALHSADIVVFLGVTTLLFAMIYKVLPDVKLRWREVWGGALLAAICFSIGRVMIGLYLGHSTIAASFGAAGSLVVLLVWIYYSAQILLLGAEYTRARIRVIGPPVEPKEGAARMPPDACRPEPAVRGPTEAPRQQQQEALDRGRGH